MFATNYAEYIKEMQKDLQLSDLDMSRLLNVSVPTIDRWKRGVSSPHELAEESIVKTIEKSKVQILANDFEILD